ncbi:hypothetical protein NQ318_023488 [Aromia moschata]|uniref:Uncharacterized protein n=1 Tax=Aromia moschata TaxID=1265417 RepID=A0AAV8YRS1_9CUCU|nr:hypothetical protein NQ318_023488 [Aromia moschata]
MVAKDNLPINVTEKEGFKYLIKTVAPTYQLPGHNGANMVKAITDVFGKKQDEI